MRRRWCRVSWLGGFPFLTTTAGTRSRSQPRQACLPGDILISELFQVVLCRLLYWVGMVWRECFCERDIIGFYHV